jgi:alkylation response protein AidB-like acyl-CoA dehydrogenase
MTELTLFTEEVRTFINENLTPELKKAGELSAGVYADQPVALEWHKILNTKGWAVPTWPVAWGGTDWSPTQHAIFSRELTLSMAPPISPNSTRMVGPVLIEFGTDEQKSCYLPRIRAGDDWWAQGYSEPGAGSDLASLTCAAVRDGDHYVINGSKIWTTHAQWSNKIFCLVRTDTSGKPQHGITFLLFDLDLNGIQVKPLISISGDHEFNQVFFDDVRVPVTSLLGVENQGWTVAKYLLQHERGGKSATALQVRFEHLKAFLSGTDKITSALANDSAYRNELALLGIAIDTFSSLENKVFSAVASGRPVGTISSALKIRRSELKQQLTQSVMTAVNYYGLVYQPQVRTFGSNADPIGSRMAATAAPQYLNDRAATIYAGSTEIQKNIIAKATLGL